MVSSALWSELQHQQREAMRARGLTVQDCEVVEIPEYADILAAYKAQDYVFDPRLGKPAGIQGDVSSGSTSQSAATLVGFVQTTEASFSRSGACRTMGQ